MPERYVKMKRRFKADGLSDAKAKTKAARIFNATRKRGEPPVTGPHNRKRRTTPGFGRTRFTR